MKYFKLGLRKYYELGMVPASANGDNIPNASKCFWAMNEGIIILDAPIFDSFFLESFDKKKFWEWRLDDVHSFMGEGSQIRGWLISEKFKRLLENFNLAKPHCFYPSKLLYKKKKLDYYIYQFAGKLITNEIRTTSINWHKSIFFNPIDESYSSINSMQEFIDESRRIMKLSKYDNEIKLLKLTLKNNFDFFPMGTYLNDDIVSERLKQAMEDNGITGFEFFELDYEVVVKGE